MNAHLVDIFLGMFFFAGRCCEYAEPSQNGRTKQIAMGDLVFRDANKLEMKVDCKEDINQAQYVTAQFQDQKNGDKHNKQTQGRTWKTNLDPVTQLGWAVLRIKGRVEGWDKNTDLCTIGTVPNRLRITNQIILETIRDLCRMHGGKTMSRFSPEEIGNKSLRSGAAIALALSRQNHSEMKIMIIG